jgi:cytochrome P450
MTTTATLLPGGLSLAEPPRTPDAIWTVPSARPAGGLGIFCPRPIDVSRVPVVVTRYADVLAVLDDDGPWRHAADPETLPADARRYVPDSSWMLDGVPWQPLLGAVRRLNRGYPASAREFSRDLTGLLLATLIQQPPPWNLSRVIDEVAARVAIEHVLCAPPLLDHLPRLRSLASRRRTERLTGTGPHPYGHFSADSQRELEEIFRAVDKQYASLPDGIARELVLLHRRGELDFRQMASSLDLLFVVHEQLPALVCSMLALILEHDLLGYTRQTHGNPELTGRLLDEGLRRGLSFPVGMTTAVREAALPGTTLPAGTQIVISFAAANVDPGRFGPDPDAFDPARQRPAHIAFGRGGNRCLAAKASRDFAEDVLYALLAGLPDIRLGHGGQILREVTGVAWTVPELLVEPC